MNRKQKIIISVTGIFIVLLILVGLTYAYFLTRIQGNTNSKSISVTTADLKLTYGDGNGIITGEKIMPGTTIDTKTFTVTNEGNSVVTYGTAFIDMIYQDLSNNKDIDKFEYQDDLIYSLECTSYKTEGLTYNTDGTVQSGTETGECNGVTEGVLPTRTDLSLIITNKIEVGITHVYKLKITYKETGIDQSIDMNKKIEGKIDIIDLKRNSNELNPYSKNKESLAYNIINNAIENTNGTSFNPTSITTPVIENSSFKYKTDENIDYLTPDTNMTVTETQQSYYWTYGTDYVIDENTGKFSLKNVKTCKYDEEECNKKLVGNYLASKNVSDNFSETDTKASTENKRNIYKVVSAPDKTTGNITMELVQLYYDTYSTEKELSITIDDYGTSYYYRGGVEDNYVNFAGMCFRIVRIEGDGSIKLVLDDKNVECSNTAYTGNWTGDSVVYGNDENNKIDFINYSNGLADALKDFQTSKLVNFLDKLKVESWCYDNSLHNEHYGSSLRVDINKKASLICDSTKLTKYKNDENMYVGTLTVDELSYAGVNDEFNDTHYLVNEYTKYDNEISWWLISPRLFLSSFNYDVSFAYEGFRHNLTGQSVHSTNNYRPSITLLPNSIISSGNGTKTNPYIIK